MFVKVLFHQSYMARKNNNIPARLDLFDSTVRPRTTSQKGESGKASSGTYLVAQYIEMYLFRRRQYYKISDVNCNSVYQTALTLDDVLVNSNYIQKKSDGYPSLESTMQAFINLGQVTETNGVGFINTGFRDDIKYFIRQYGGIILECKLTSTIYNKPNDTVKYSIDEAGSVLFENYTKGFIACGYDSNYLYVQNSLGRGVGSNGFHRINWNVVNQIAIKGAVFKLG